LVALGVHRFERAGNDAVDLARRALMIVFGSFCIAHFYQLRQSRRAMKRGFGPD